MTGTGFPRHNTILGSTGSIGRQTLDIVRCFPQHFQVVAATSGLVGLRPTLAAIHAGKTIALANKETLVMARHLVTYGHDSML